MRVVVIGAGVNGVGSALAIQEAVPEVQVTIVAENFTPDTTGDGAAGLWGPHLIAGDPKQVARWGRRTHDLFHHLWLEGDCPGIGLFSGVDSVSEPEYADVPFFCEEVPPSQPGGERRYRTVTFYAEPAKLLPFLLERFRARGGTTVQAKVTSLEELAVYDVIVNCSGLGARQLVGDLTVHPIRGQVVRVRCHAVKRFGGAKGSYFVPNDDVVVLGGTAQRGDWRRAPDGGDTARIVDGCCRLVPTLAGAPKVAEWAGLRPFREAGVRLERERRRLAGREVPVVHNYGHGGAGVTLFWGCGLDVAQLVREEVQNLVPSSKL